MGRRRGPQSGPQNETGCPGAGTADPAPAELAAALARLCEREGLDAGETTAVLAVALARAPGLPRNPTPLLRQFTLAA